MDGVGSCVVFVDVRRNHRGLLSALRLSQHDAIAVVLHRRHEAARGIEAKRRGGAVQHAHLRARGQVPERDRLSAAGAHQPAAVGAERGALVLNVETPENAPRGAVADRPDAGEQRVDGGNDDAVVEIEHHR